MSEFGKDINVPSRKGVFIPDITVEMFRNASLEGVEDLMASGEMEDISLPSAQPERPEQPESAKEYCAECNHIEMCRWYPYEGCEFRSLPSVQPEIIRCKDCKHREVENGFCEGRGWPMQLVPDDGFCDKGEGRTDG